MGTRADFYVGRGPKAEWLGSIAWDGNAVPERIALAATEAVFREAVADFLSQRDDATLPEQGWPWPWKDSEVTDYAWAFDERTWRSCFGSAWQSADEPEPEDYDETPPPGPAAVFPDMSERKRVATGKRSGMIVFASKGGAA